jgi:hypothetical protein
MANEATAVVEETTPETTPATEAPATEAPATETPETTDEPASRVTLKDALDNTVKLNVFLAASPQLKRTINQFEGLERLMVSMRQTVLEMLAVENKNFTEGEHTVFATFVKVSFFNEKLAVKAQGLLKGEIAVDDEGEID